eukprot:6333327-Pyramimonas_sp.AAC.1
MRRVRNSRLHGAFCMRPLLPAPGWPGISRGRSSSSCRSLEPAVSTIKVDWMGDVQCAKPWVGTLRDSGAVAAE